MAWLAASALFSFYVTNFSSYDATYGSLGAVVILLLWFWVGALVLLAGAEIDAELEVRDKANLDPAKSLRWDGVEMEYLAWQIITSASSWDRWHGLRSKMRMVTRWGLKDRCRVEAISGP
jgi:hypothetical protein